MYGRAATWTELPRVVDAALGNGAREVKVKLLLWDKAFARRPNRAAGPFSQGYTEMHRRSGSVVGEIQGYFGRDKQEIVGGKFLAVQSPEIPVLWAIVTDAGSDFLKRPFRHFLRGATHRAIAPILRTPQMEELLQLLQRDRRVHELRVTQMGYRAPIHSHGARKAVERDRRWTDLTLEEAFSEALEAGQWVTDVTAQFNDEAFGYAQVKIGRYGVFTFERRARIALDTLLAPAAKMAFDWYQFLKNRQRAATTHYHSRPFNIEFNYPALESRDQVLELAQTLSSIPAVTCTVLHGNPYFHAVLVDFQDGSTYEALVLRENALTVIPQGRATVGALQRLCSRVFSNFREGELRELEQGA